MSFSFDVGATGEQARLQNGEYIAICESADVRQTRAGNGQYLNCKFVVADGPCKGKVVWQMFNFENPSEVAQRIGREQLSRLCKAVGFKDGDKLTSTDMIVGKPLRVTVEQKQRKDNGDNYFEIVKFDAVDKATFDRLKAEFDSRPLTQSDTGEAPF